jgi:hypothetical protein
MKSNTDYCFPASGIGFDLHPVSFSETPDLHYLIPTLFPPYNSDIPLPDPKMGGQDLDQGVVGPALNRRSSEIDLKAVLFDNYLVLFGFGYYPYENHHR